MSVVVIGQIGRDPVLRTDGPPSARESTTVLRRDELLGGKGSNQAVGLAQLGVPVALIGVVGDDSPGRSVLQQAQRDGIDVDGVAQRGATALLIDIVGRPPERMPPNCRFRLRTDAYPLSAVAISRARAGPCR